MPFNPPLAPPMSPMETPKLLGSGDGVVNPSPVKQRFQGPLLDEALRINASALAFESTSEGVIITDAACRIVLVNSAFEHITGYRESEVKGRTCAFLQGPLTDPQSVQTIRDALQKRTAFSGEILNYCQDGSLYWNDLGGFKSEVQHAGNQ